jgi:polyhydroxyalkanoate synthesis regulator phasin
MLEDLRGYLQLVSGLTEVTARRARDLAGSLVSRGTDLDTLIPEGATSRVQDLADELVATSRANRELLIGLIRTEVDRAVGRLGFIREEELAAVRAHVARLEVQIDKARSSTKKTATRTAKRTATKTAKRTATKTAKRTATKTVEKATMTPAPDVETDVVVSDAVVADGPAATAPSTIETPKTVDLSTSSERTHAGPKPYLPVPEKEAATIPKPLTTSTSAVEGQP